MARLSDRERAQLPDRAFAYIDAAGTRKLPIHDPAHVRNALTRFGRVRFESDEARDRARQRLLNAAKKHGIMPVGFVTGQLRSERRGPMLPTGAVTFVLTDIEDSTALVQALGDGYAGVLRDVRRLVAEAVAAGDGVKVDAHGDEFLAVFERPAAAVQATVALQLAIAQRAWPGGRVVRVRVGVHSGRPTLTDDGYVGLSLHAVARICTVAHGGQVIVSGQTRAVLGDLPEGLRLSLLGSHRLTGLPRSEDLYQLGADGLPDAFPPLRLTLGRATVASTGSSPGPDVLGQA